jgi:hypothetical protein
MTNISKSKTWSDDEVLNAPDLNQGFDDIINVVNGNIDTNNIADNGVGTDEIANGAVTNTKLNTAAGEVGGAWSPSTCTLTVAAGTAPSYSTNAWRTTVIGKTVIASLALSNTSGGTAGNGNNPLFVSLPYAAKSSMRIGHGAVYNGGTAIMGTRVICNFEVVAASGTSTAYLAVDDSNITATHQNNANRYIYLTVTYEIA